MKIQSALHEELATKSDSNREQEESRKAGDKCTTFKRPLSCSKCGKAFTTKFEWDCHERIHTGNKQ